MSDTQNENAETEKAAAEDTEKQPPAPAPDQGATIPGSAGGTDTTSGAA